ncbi:MAG: hypothetical protein H5U00_10635 [Clostridia bacterium]|nr:hypothetical protein [Clostridia bacterium]
MRVVLRPENIYRDVRHVFEAAVAPPPGPVVLALADDPFFVTLERCRPALPVLISPGRPRQDCLRQAAAPLAGARRPVALAG